MTSLLRVRVATNSAGRNCVITLMIALFTLSLSFADGDNAIMRYPDVHGNLVAFSYGGDIWTAPKSGGVATRLTIHDGTEGRPQFSPDGKMIAFSGQYDGNTDVYIMNIHGGDIRRVTYHPGADIVTGWHPTKNKILFRSAREDAMVMQLFLISTDGTGLEKLILHEAGFGSFSPDGQQIAYNRLSRERRTWKRYYGGIAQDIYVFDFQTQKENKLTDYKGTDRLPMWYGNKIYFSSDRDKVLNLYSLDVQTGETTQLTKHTQYDVRYPNIGDGTIVYEFGGTIRMYDTENGVDKQIPIEIKTDVPGTRPYLKDVKKFVTNFDCSPSGERAAIVARGEIFSVPRKHGRTLNLTKSSGFREKDAAWSPDGKKIAYISDKSGEYQIYIMDQAGNEKAVQLTHYKDGYRHTLRWSPDSKKIAFADQTLRCYYLDVASGKITEVDKANYEQPDVSLDKKQIYDFTWSPDSRFIAYSKMTADQIFQIHIYSLETGETHRVSNGLFNDFQPVFTKDGKHLLFVSNRHFDPTLSDFEWEMVYKDAAKICALTLQKNGDPLLPFRNDEVETKPEDGNNSKTGSGNESQKISIDFEGIQSRIEMLPLPRGNYRSLAVNETSLFYLNAEKGDFNRFEFREIGPGTLYSFSFEDRKESTVIKGIDGYKLSANGNAIVYKMRRDIGIIDAHTRESHGEHLDLSGLKMKIDPMAEWEQMFNEAWRMQRDFYYEPNMQGVNWTAMKEKYGKLLPYASSRDDVTYLIGELIGELSTSHTYVFGGDEKREADKVNVGLLGADYEVHQNRYRFKKIYRTPDWTDDIMAPLERLGVDVRAGDYLLQVNGEDVKSDKNLYSYFQDLAGKQITLMVNDKPSLKGAREVVVKPVRNERTLRYLSWVEHNRKVVGKESNGKIGYIHFPDTYMGSAEEFPKYFYSQLRKEGLIIDGRFNRGGLDPNIFLERLEQPLIGYWTRRYSHDQTIPPVVTTARMVCLTNKQAGSGGDMFPWEFRERGMGPIIGTRTWGGLVGVSMWIPLIDGGILSAPDYRIYDRNGNWIIENEGVTPDIIVEQDPVEMARGYDAQLMKGIEELKKKIKEDPRPWPKHQPYPVRESGKSFED